MLARPRIADDGRVIDPAQPRAPARWPWLAAVLVLGAAAFLGFQAAYQSSLGGLGGALGAAFRVYAIGGLAVIAVLVGVANALRPEGQGRAVSRYAFAAAGLVLAGAAVGYAAVPVFDLGYHPPVILEARGEASAVLQGVPAFEPRDAGRADCQSVADGTDVERVVAMSLGRMNGNVLRADISLPLAGVSSASVSLFVDAAQLPKGSTLPVWTSLDAETEALPVGDGTGRGTIHFVDAPIQRDPKLGTPSGEWPATLSGEISWSCGRWADP